MPIQVRLFAAFAEFVGKREFRVEHSEGMNCTDLWRQITEKYPKAGKIPALFAIGDEYVPPETVLNDGDVVMVFPPVSGGNSKYIYEEPLSLQRAVESIHDENGGGEAIFMGRVRRRNEGRDIKYLFYECQIPMAEKQIRKIIDEMRSKWPLKRVHIEHRIGKLEVGDLAVIVAVSAEHRQEAMEACRYGIDQLKHRVPIWKKEYSDTGEEWIGACSDDK